MSFLITFFVFMFGTIVGSFLNVVILRYNTGMKFFGKIRGPKERSMCFSCGKKLLWYELVPVFSFCFLRGKCAGCKSKISWQYPLVEIVTGAIFVGIWQSHFSTVLSMLHGIIWSLLIVITVYDMRHKIIPDALVYAFSMFAFVATLLVGFFQAQSGAVAAEIGSLLLDRGLAALIFFSFFGGLWWVSGGRWLGFGDAKLVVGVGLLLGLVKGITALTLAFWIGAVVSIALLAFQAIYRKVVQVGGLRTDSPALTMKSEIPFAPFIILGTLIAFFWNADVFNIVGQLLTF
jgi:leader peptidase (prepilin peptidase)/N-methyltransferase